MIAFKGCIISHSDNLSEFMTSQSKDFMYENAPVVEVIAEVHWQLKPLLDSNLEYDPFFEDFADVFSEEVTKEGFDYRELLVANEVPKELLAHKAIFRFRKDKDQWPLYQIGPGIFTVNITPPYNGWQEFFRTISQGIDFLYQYYPFAQKYLVPYTLRLIYINAFGKNHGYTSLRDFITNKVNFTISLPEELNAHVEEESLDFVTDFNFRLKDLKDSFATIKIGTGTFNGEPAVLIENRIFKHLHGTKVDKDNIKAWFNEARDINRGLFEKYINQTTRDTFGSKLPYNESE